MKYPATIIASCLLMAFLIYEIYDADTKMKIKDDRVKELELQVWSLKLDKRLDSIKDHALETFHNRLNH